MRQGFRFEPTTVHRDRVIPRARITHLLNGRFTHRVTTIVGAAGFGKTTSLALALENNSLDPIGRDVWMSAIAADGDPVHLMNGLAAALDVVVTGDGEPLERIVDALWSTAPDDIAIIIDDVHHVIGTPSAAALQSLLEAMPTNAHLVLGSRRRLDLPLARLRAHGELLEITEADLALDDDEVARLITLSGDRSDLDQPVGDPTQLPRHVATADLQLAAGITSSADFLWEEILSSLEPDRLLHLRRAAVLEELDDELILAITDGAFDATALVAGLPLVDRIGDSGLRMHAILREALIARLQPGEHRKTLAVAADAERARRRFPAALSLYHLAGDDIAAMDTARDYVLTPIVFQSVEGTISTRQIVDKIDSSSPVALTLEAITRFGGLEHELIPLFEAAAAAACNRNDIELEVAALNRIMQALLLDNQFSFEHLIERAGELSALSETARSVHAHFRSIEYQLAGDAERSLRELDHISDLDPAREYVTRASRLCDLGRPEHVAIGFGTGEIAQLPPGAELFVGLALWLRGDAEPELANTLATVMIEQVLRRGFTHPTVSALAITSFMALAAGETALAERRVRHAAELSWSGVGASITDLVRVARAAVAAVRDGDESSMLILGEAPVDDAQVWPSRGQLMSVPLVYINDPGARKMLQRCSLGPSLTTAVQAGAAVVALRERNDPQPASELPWSQPILLRVHVLPPHLVELACAAISHGNETARDILETIPGVTELLRRVAQISAPAAADVAQRMLGTIIRVEPFRLHAALLGPIGLYRDGTPVEHAAFVKRPKVRELFALLLERGTLDRSELCEMLWPDHDDEDKALANLRTALSTLNDVLEPDRARGEAAFHVKIVGDSVAIDPRVTTDVSEFEELFAAAQADDNAGLPARALDTYRRCVDTYRGNYLHGVEASWIVLSRLRLRTLAVSAMCRLAELTAAKGEPEEASRWAAQARRIDPLNERAGRTFIAALDAVGDRSAARTAVEELVATLRAAGLDLTPPTQRLIARISPDELDHRSTT
jgi:LuxR family transcriptional regulator, maltose regulon positive regulatory protein